MSDRVIPEGIPELGLLPKAIVQFAIEELEETTTGTGKYNIKALLRAEEPTALAGMPLYMNFVIGTNDDPEASEPATWQQSFGSRNLNTMSLKAGVRFAGRSVSEALSELKGQKVLGNVTVQKQPETNKDGSPNQYAGNESNNITSWYSVGTREPVILEQPGLAAAPAKAAAKPAAKPVPGKPAAAPAVKQATPAAKPVQLLVCDPCVQAGVEKEAASFPRAEFLKHVTEAHPE